MFVPLGLFKTLFIWMSSGSARPSAPFTAPYSALKIYSKFRPLLPKEQALQMVTTHLTASSGEQAGSDVSGHQSNLQRILGSPSDPAGTSWTLELG